MGVVVDGWVGGIGGIGGVLSCGVERRRKGRKEGKNEPEWWENQRLEGCDVRWVVVCDLIEIHT